MTITTGMDEDFIKLNEQDTGDAYEYDYFYRTRNFAEHIDHLRSFLVKLQRAVYNNPDTSLEELYVELDYPNTGVGEAVDLVRQYAEKYGGGKEITEITTELGDAFVSCDHDRIDEAIENMFRLKDKLIPVKDEFNRRTKALLGEVKRAERRSAMEYRSIGGDEERSGSDAKVDNGVRDTKRKRSKKTTVQASTDRGESELS